VTNELSSRDKFNGGALQKRAAATVRKTLSPSGDKTTNSRNYKVV